MVLLNDFSFLKINGFKKPKCWKDVDKPGPSAVIHDSGVGNKRPMCKLGVLLSAPAPSDPALASSRERSWRIEDRRVTSFVLVFAHPEPRIDSDSGLITC